MPLPPPPPVSPFVAPRCCRQWAPRQSPAQPLPGAVASRNYRPAERRGNGRFTSTARTTRAQVPPARLLTHSHTPLGGPAETRAKTLDKKGNCERSPRRPRQPACLRSQCLRLPPARRLPRPSRQGGPADCAASATCATTRTTTSCRVTAAAPTPTRTPTRTPPPQALATPRMPAAAAATVTVTVTVTAPPAAQTSPAPSATRPPPPPPPPRTPPPPSTRLRLPPRTSTA